jgi:eukaryotic-like serine/threonine-protein kinase
MTIEEFYNRFDFNADASGSEIGRGGFSVVFKAYDKVRKRFVAIKRSEVGQFAKFDLKREVEVANEIEPHVNILRYENVYRFTERLSTHDFAVMKYYSEGNLENVIRTHKLSESENLHIMKGILHGLAHIHQIPIIHRDFKTANILMDKNEKGVWIPLICDFGQSRLIDTENSMISNNSQIALTPKYSAPEQLLDTKSLRTNADLWAFGVIVYQMLKGKMPFMDEDSTGEWGRSEKIRFLILQGDVPKDIATIKEPYQSIIRQCLIVDPEKRVKTANELLLLLEKVPSNSKKAIINDVSEKTIVLSSISKEIPKKPIDIKPISKPAVSEEVKIKKTFNYLYLIPVVLLALIGSYFLFFHSSQSTVLKADTLPLDSSKVTSDSVPINETNVKRNEPIKEPKIPTKPIGEHPKVSTEKSATKYFEEQPKVNSETGILQITSDSDCIIYVDGNSYGRIRAYQSKNISLKATEGSNSYRNYIVRVENDNGEKIVENILVYAGRTNSKQLNFNLR